MPALDFNALQFGAEFEGHPEKFADKEVRP